MNSNEVFTMMDHKYALFGLFFAFHNRLQATGDSFYEEITCKQFFLLACMNLYTEEAPTGNELAKTMGCSRQNIKEILNSLENKGLVYLQPDEKDKRKNRVYRTDKCFKLSEKYKEKEIQFMQMLYEGLSDKDIDDAYRIISKIEENLINMEVK